MPIQLFFENGMDRITRCKTYQEHQYIVKLEASLRQLKEENLHLRTQNQEYAIHQQHAQHQHQPQNDLFLYEQHGQLHVHQQFGHFQDHQQYQFLQPEPALNHLQL